MSLQQWMKGFVASVGRWGRAKEKCGGMRTWYGSEGSISLRGGRWLKWGERKRLELLLEKLWMG